MTIKVLEKAAGCFPVVFKNKGDWFDLRLAEDVTFKAPRANKMHIRNKSKKDIPEERTRDVDFEWKLLPLGIAMQLPDGFEAHLLPRSSTFKDYGLILTNSTGIIDCSYRGDNDQWMMSVIATRKVTIPKGTRIAQFRIMPCQNATVWQKLRWLFSSGIKFKDVASLGNPDRKGFGEGTGEK